MLEYYSKSGDITNIDNYRETLSVLENDAASLSKRIQGLFLHIYWAKDYGVTVTKKREEELNLRKVDRQIKRIIQLSNKPLNEKRKKENRLLGTCRDFSVFMTAVLRTHNIPARARCGFATYFEKDLFVDHWICEYWNESRKKWVGVDSQLDEFQCEKLNIKFNVLDVPEDKFITAGKAWKLCCDGICDPDKFGILDMHGLGFVAGNVLLDLLSLNKIELLPWDEWGLIKDTGKLKVFPERITEILNYIASITVSIDSPEKDYFSEIRDFYRTNSEVRLPKTFQL